MRHAFEPDHVVALSTMIADARSVARRVTYAALWGVGHAVMLLVVGAILMAGRARLPQRIDAIFEVAVSLMLITLGARALLQIAKGARAQGEGSHSTWRSMGPLAMGMVHGLAGSGALTALVMARLPSLSLGIAFMLLFGVGATLGMSLLAGAASGPIKHVLRWRFGMGTLLGATGSLSLVLGALWLGPAVTHALGVP
jgi:hypothetical protein